MTSATDHRFCKEGCNFSSFGFSFVDDILNIFSIFISYLLRVVFISGEFTSIAAGEGSLNMQTKQVYFTMLHRKIFGTKSINYFKINTKKKLCNTKFVNRHVATKTSTLFEFDFYSSAPYKLWVWQKKIPLYANLEMKYKLGHIIDDTNFSAEDDDESHRLQQRNCLKHCQNCMGMVVNRARKCFFLHKNLLHILYL